MFGRKQIQDISVDEEDDVRLHIDSLVSSIKATVSRELLISPNCCIFKVPVTHCRRNINAFIPNAFSIGPLHHGKQNLKATEKIKARYLEELISRSPSPETMLSSMVSSIMEVEKKARESYADAIHYNRNELVKILVIDGCFIIEFLRKCYLNDSVREDDPIFSKSMPSFLSHDLMLLENQVPWMVLKRLFKLTTDPRKEPPLIILAMRYMRLTFLSHTIDLQSDLYVKMKGIKHFVDLLRKLSTSSSINHPPDQSINNEGTDRLVHLFRKLSHLPSRTEEKKGRRREWELLPSATSLVEAGIKFEKSKSQSILDIKFEDGILKIPPLMIDDTTETLFRNLISYEQCLLRCEDRFTSYIMFLDNLIITTKDMDILCENQIIHNWLNPEDATQLFNKLYYDTCVNYCYTKLCGDVNRFCKRRWPRWRAMLVRNYFNTPWAVLSTSAAVILLILTLLQTVYGIKK